jgi:methylmalonyl-CoA/ethylmalonyl-CoA epimerase
MPETTADVRLSRIGQIAITVSDLGRSVEFYRDKLGMKFLFQVPNLAFFDCGGIRLMLSPREKAADGSEPVFSSVVYYKVDDINAAHAALSARGVEFEQGPHLIAKMPDHELWMAFFRDPDRNVLALMSEVRPG